MRGELAIANPCMGYCGKRAPHQPASRAASPKGEAFFIFTDSSS